MTLAAMREKLASMPIARCGRCGLVMAGDQCVRCDVPREPVVVERARNRKRRAHWQKVKPPRFESLLSLELHRSAAPIIFKKAHWYLDWKGKWDSDPHHDKVAERIAKLLVSRIRPALAKLGRSEFSEDEVMDAWDSLVEVALIGACDLETGWAEIDEKGQTMRGDWRHGYVRLIRKGALPRKGRWTFCKRCGFPRYRRASYLRRPRRGQFCSIACKQLYEMNLP